MAQPAPLQVESNPNEPILGGQAGGNRLSRAGTGLGGGGNAAAVRTTFWNEIEGNLAVKSAYARILLWSVWLFYSVYVNWQARNTSCETPLAFWTQSMLMLHISHSAIALNRSRPLPEVQRRIQGMGLVIFVWYVFGSGWVTPSSCDPGVVRNGAWLWWLMTSLYLAPCFLAILILCCFPVILVALPYLIVPSANRVATRDDILSKLPKVKYGELPPVPSPGTNDDGMETTCSICAQDFEAAESVVRLPCHPKHTFHDECIMAWLRMSQLCPICRRNIAELVGNDANLAATGNTEGEAAV